MLVCGGLEVLLVALRECCGCGVCYLRTLVWCVVCGLYTRIESVLLVVLLCWRSVLWGGETRGWWCYVSVVVCGSWWCLEVWC